MTALCDKQPSVLAQAACVNVHPGIGIQQQVCFFVTSAGVELERHFRTALCDKEPSVMAPLLLLRM
jgi:hypothetical protein